MSRPDIYNEVYNYAKEYITENSKYSPLIFKNAPTESKTFPLIIIKQDQTVLVAETLKTTGTEKEYKMTFPVEIFAGDVTVNSKHYSNQTVVRELLQLLYEVFEDKLGFIGDEPLLRPNTDTKIARYRINFSCKYKNNKIYRR